MEAFLDYIKYKEKVEQIRHAEILCTIYRAQGGKCKVEDFLPHEDADDEDCQVVLMQWAMAHNAKLHK